MRARFNHFPGLNLTRGVALQLSTPDTPAPGVGIVRCNCRTARLASAPSLVWFAGDDIEVELSFVRLGMTPREVRSLEVHSMHEWTTFMDCSKSARRYNGSS